MTAITILYLSLAAIFSFAMAFFQYRYRENGKYPLLLVLRFLALLGLLVLLINPKIRSQEYIEVKPILNILVDNSKSISYASKEEEVKQLVDEVKSDKRVNEKFDVHPYYFADDIYFSDSASFNGNGTDIYTSLNSLNKLVKDRTAPVLLITDGNQTTGSSYEFFSGKQVIYPLVIGDTATYDDISITRVNVNSYSNLMNKFPVEVFIHYDGNSPVSKNFRVTENGHTVYQKTIRFNSIESAQKVNFYLEGTSVGNHNYGAHIGVLYNEKNTFNNDKHFNVEVLDEQAKILLVSSINHPDLGMIKRSIETNKLRKVNIQTNLNNNLKLKDYQLIILYQPNNKFNDILNRIITEKATVFVITGTQTDWEFLNKSQPFFKKSYINTFEQYGAIYDNSYDGFIVDDPGFEGFPPLEDYFGRISFDIPYKTLLQQQVQGFDTGEPLLATFSNDDVRKAVLFGNGIWKWRMADNVEHGSFEGFDNFFSKLIQYLSSDKQSSRLEIKYNPTVYASTPFTIRAQYFDANYTFDSSAILELNYVNKTTNEMKSVPFTLKETDFEATLPGLTEGDYQFTVQVLNTAYKKSGTFKVLDYDIEQQLTVANVDKLRQLALNNHGALIYPDRFKQALDQLVSDKQYSTIQRSTEKVVSLIDKKWLLGLIALLLSAEWFIRKYKGLI